MSRGSNLHRTEEGRKKLNFTDKLKKKQNEKKYQQNQNKQRKNESTSTSKVSEYTKQGKKRTPAQMAAARRLAEKKAGTYKKPMSIKERVKNKLKIKKKKK